MKLKHEAGLTMFDRLSGLANRHASPVRPIRDPDVAWLTTAGALAAAGLLRAANPYRSFPSIDDFAYLPMALSRLDARLYARDVLLQDTPLHLPLLPPLVALLRWTTTLQLGFWLLTVALSVLTVLGLYRWMRALGVPGALLPLAAVVLCSGRIQGLGRGEYDGVFGDAFHSQWAALCALIWAYDGLLRNQRLRTVGFLVLSLLFHPVVGVHAAGAMAFGFAFKSWSERQPHFWLPSVPTGLLAFVMFLLWLAPGSPDLEGLARLPETVQALFFRTHEYDIDRLRTMVMLVLVAAGICGTARLTRRTSNLPAAVLLGLLTGHLLLLGANCLLFHPAVFARWSSWTLLPIQLSLTRTTPVLLTLSSIAAVAALEAGFFETPWDRPTLSFPVWFGVRATQAAAVVWIAVIQVLWSWQTGVCCVVAAVTAFAVHQRSKCRPLLVAWALAGAAGLLLFAGKSSLDASVSIDQQQLFQWARSGTQIDSLFVVPPGLQEFRWYARRGVYVDFKMMTPTDARLVRLWRHRLERVAAPDLLAREARGWEGVPQWDRTYAGRNTPTRIAWLLRDTRADYFVWDRQGLQIPPFLQRDREPNPAVVIAFENARYQVYRLSP